MKKASGRARKSRKEPGPPETARITPARPSSTRPSLARRWPANGLGLLTLASFALTLAVVVFVFHKTPGYGVETDLFGDSIPAAQALAHGSPAPHHYEYKGPGYPLLLLLATFLSGGNAWFGARLLNVVAAVLGAGFVFLLFREKGGLDLARFTLLALCVNPLYWRTSIEAGTDMPAFALAITSTWLVLCSQSQRAAAGAGALAGFAILCRYNTAFLVPAALVAIALPGLPNGSRARRLLAYGAGLTLVLGPWLVANRALTGSPFTNRNYANLAYELYGRGMGWDVFWSDVAPRFSGFGEVVRYDPAGALVHWGRNLATRWLLDLRQLVPVWLGVAAVPGAILGVIAVRRNPAQAVGFVAHYVFCYATLALVFYTPRFFLYLVPFYLAAAGLFFLPPGRSKGWLRKLGIVLAAAALAGSAVMSARQTGAQLAADPFEIVEAGHTLKKLAPPGARLLARKPQVAWFAGMEYVPLPNVETLRELLTEARRLGAPYLFLSGIEASLRPQFTLLNEGEVALPGFERLARRMIDARHFYTLYRIDPDSAVDRGFSDSLLVALRDMAQRYADVPAVQAYVGALLIDEGKHAEALVVLDRAIALQPGALQPVGFRALALVELGRLDEAAHDCETVLARMPRPPASFALLLGTIRARQGRLPDAEKAFELASSIEPANAAAQLDLGLVRLAGGNDAGATEPFERAIRLLPALAPVRDRALAAARANRPEEIVRIIESVRRTGGGSGQIASLVDSLDRASRR